MTADRFLKLKEVTALTSLAASTIYRKMEQGIFPRPRRLSEACVRWFASDVEKWMVEQAASGK
ncbi:AlpA family phage regulatory protein (plasmid) [Rhizobium tumorigenes]|uniref:AlpA family phage regulatory protein n=2 Tax=Rhizobium tumorigenes TaxID=2041385 RepID=A0AAF1KB51_9HYPH|nr:AlpA family phage regulatory protein [Rhizobium tumorigenes]WFR98879.1 AlpA family phage regulatory protein [Rhizobium tumorigenes]